MANHLDSSTTNTTRDGLAKLTVRNGAKALVSTSGAVLLVKEQHADGTPFWTLPGGGVHTHESEPEGLRRELIEELHCQSHVTDPVTSFWYAHTSRPDTVSVYTVYECSLLSDVTPNRTEGILDYRWVEPTDIPPATVPQVRYAIRNGCGPS